ncbi:MAG: hypothetical protein EA353_07860 [Puniceicoccaceae bacterium]|nr:MAG: hypothetical protein EA353_07860 [Puniceicoccaceae bacterium]
MNQIKHLIRALLLSVILICPLLAHDIDGTWYLNGFHNEVHAQSSVPAITTVTGTATINISGGTISLNTNMGNLTESEGFIQSGDTYRMSYFDGPVNAPYRVVIIRVIDENTLAFSRANIELDSIQFGIEESIGMAGVLTRSQIPEVDPEAWTGSFTVEGVMLREFNDEREGVDLRVDDSTAEISANPNGTSFSAILEDEPWEDNFTASQNTLQENINNFSDYRLWFEEYTYHDSPDVDTLEARHVQTREQIRMLQIGGGKIAAFIIYNQRARTISTWPEYDGLNYMSSFEYASFILVPEGIAVVTEVGGIGNNAQIIREGEVMTPYVGFRLLDGDFIITGESTFIRALFSDETTMTLGPNSECEVGQFPANDVGIIRRLHGWLRASIAKQYASGEAVEVIRTRTAGIGVRGTVFETEHNEVNGIATTTCTVESGLVEVTEYLTGNVTLLSEGEELTLSSVIIDTEPMDTVVTSGEPVELSVTVSAANPSFQWYQGEGYDMSQPIAGATDATLTIPAVTASDDYWVLVTSGPYQGKSRLAHVSLAAVEANFQNWATTAGLSGGDAAPDAIPFGDGVSNLLKYAFNMNASGPDSSSMLPGGTAGLPVSELDTSGETPVWRVEFVRRKDGGLIYTPEKSTTLAADSFSPMTGTMTVDDLDADWERVVITEPYDPIANPSYFSRLKVEITGD